MSSYGKLDREDKWDGSGNAGQERCNKPPKRSVNDYAYEVRWRETEKDVYADQPAFGLEKEPELTPVEIAEELGKFGRTKRFGPMPPVNPEVDKVKSLKDPVLKAIVAVKPTFDMYEEAMLILRLKIYDLITEHVPDREQSLLLKKVVEYTFR
jgi:hypothetical protein